jgi:flagellin
MSANAARQLGSHYSDLSRSVQRLSTGLRINSAADDAAGLAIRELMRADNAALNQGIRNANDAISLIQTADGALSVIDEKLIRMKELAEQAATGTYDSTQRLVIDSEYQQMAKEISRIANSTDFNGLHLLDGSLESGYHNGSELTSTGKLKVHFGTGNDSAEDYYYIQIEDMTAEGMSLGDGGTAVVAREKLERKFVLNLEELLKPKVDDGTITKQEYDAVIAEVLRSTNAWTDGSLGVYYPADFQNAFVDTFGTSIVPRPRDSSFSGPEGFTYAWLEGMDTGDWTTIYNTYNALTGDEKEKYRYAFLRQSVENMGSTLASGNIFYTTLPPYNMNIDPSLQGYVQKAGVATTQWFADRHTYAGQNIRTQENAQHALAAVNAGIIIKDKVRASLGATQNRLENTTSNLTIQGENLQAAESRISDVDVATEMTDFTRAQVLTQAAAAMLAQANSMPRMALNLIGG